MAKESVLDLAKQTLSKHRCERSTYSSPEPAQDEYGLESNIILHELPEAHKRFNPSLAELEEILGDKWLRVCDDPYRLAQWIKLIRENRMIEAGVIPEGFKYWAYCEYCGDVLLDFQPISDTVMGCPWCFSKKKPNFTSKK